MIPQSTTGWNRALLGKDAICWHANALPALIGPKRWHATEIGSHAGYRPTRKGRGVMFTDVAEAGVDFGVIQPVQNNAAWSLLVLAAPTSSTKAQIAFSQRTSGGVGQFSCTFNTDQSFAASAGSFALIATRPSPTTTCWVRAASQVDGNLHCWGAYNNTANTGKIWRDGAAQTIASSAAMSGTSVASTQRTRIGNAGFYSGTGFQCVDPLLMVIAWSRQVPDWLLRRLTLFPELAFMPARRKLAPSAQVFNPAWARGANAILQPGVL